MNVCKPAKPVFSKGFLIYTAIALAFWLLMILTVFSPTINGSDYNNDGVVDYKDKYVLSDNSFGEDMFNLFLFKLSIFSPY